MSEEGSRHAIGVEPIDVCSLSRSELDERITWVRSELMPHVEGRARLASGVALEFRDAPGVAERLDHWIELERACCSGLSWERVPAAAGDRLRIEIGGVNPDGALFGQIPLLDESEEEGGVSPGRIRRVLRASGIGTAVALFVCCGLPMLIAPLLGAGAVAGALRALDQPLWIALVAGATSFVAWRRFAPRLSAAAR